VPYMPHMPYPFSLRILPYASVPHISHLFHIHASQFLLQEYTRVTSALHVAEVSCKCLTLIVIIYYVPAPYKSQSHITNTPFLPQDRSGASTNLRVISHKDAAVWRDYVVPLPAGDYRVVLKVMGQMASLLLDHIYLTETRGSEIGTLSAF
jgi:hypothetical protein